MSKIRDSLQRQLDERIELRDRLLSSTAKQVAEYDADIRDLKTALGALDADAPSTGVKYVPDNKLTIKDMILEILALCPQGASAQDLRANIKERFNLDLKRESLSPQLSRLRKDDQKVELRGKRWFLIDEIEIIDLSDPRQTEFDMMGGDPNALPN